MTERLEIRTPDDWHLHLRDGAVMRSVLPETARHFARALVMPNLDPPVVTAAQAETYRRSIMGALPAGSRFQPLMTLYLTERTDPADVRAAASDGLISAVKLYPAGATTNSESGVRDFSKITPVLEVLSETGAPLCVHGEVADFNVDVFDREAVFIERVLDPLRARVPGLKVVLEHATTADAVAYVRENQPSVAATITVHHLLINRNHLLAGGIRPHFYCAPIAKREKHRIALREAATGGESCFFLGTDSAPHPDRLKESSCGCAGVFTATVALPCLARVFEDRGALDRLERFASLSGAEFYGVDPNEGRVVLEKSDDPEPAPSSIEAGGDRITVFNPGIEIKWRVAARYGG